jgi:hypothetical protein
VPERNDAFVHGAARRRTFDRVNPSNRCDAVAVRAPWVLGSSDQVSSDRAEELKADEHATAKKPFADSVVESTGMDVSL